MRRFISPPATNAFSSCVSILETNVGHCHTISVEQQNRRGNGIRARMGNGKAMEMRSKPTNRASIRYWDQMPEGASHQVCEEAEGRWTKTRNKSKAIYLVHICYALEREGAGTVLGYRAKHRKSSNSILGPNAGSCAAIGFLVYTEKSNAPTLQDPPPCNITAYSC